MIRKITSLLIAGIMGGTLTAVADEIEFTYNPGLENASVYGYNRKESYDVAIRIANPQYTGTRVKGFKVNLPVTEEAIEDVTGWLSTELKLTEGVNTPDITTVPGDQLHQDRSCGIPRLSLYFRHRGNISRKPRHNFHSVLQPAGRSRKKTGQGHLH